MIESLQGRFDKNLRVIRERIADAAARSGRDSDAVTLVAVTKYVDDVTTRALVGAGATVLGESRPQHLLPKVETLSDLSVEWHMIGHLQRNKARRVLPVVSLTHSVDSLRLLEAVDRIANEDGLFPHVLLEVNVSHEAAKDGFSEEDLPLVLKRLETFSNVRVRGLMAMAGLASDVGEARREFAALRELRDRWEAQVPEGHSLHALSMGMSRDFEVAIEEGATIVRVGSILFEGVER